MDKITLDKEINNLKETLYILMTYNNLTDENVVECSQKLDKLIVEYQSQKNFF
jgi:Spo0E like sporulation regulatory protein.